MNLTQNPEYLAYLRQLEQEKKLPAGLLESLMRTESAGNPQAVSPAGAQGAFQFMPATARQYGIDPTNPQQSASAAAQMMSELLSRYGGDIDKALAGYNWGMGNVERKGMENRPAETIAHAQRVKAGMQKAQPVMYASTQGRTDVPVQDWEKELEQYKVSEPASAKQAQVQQSEAPMPTAAAMPSYPAGYQPAQDMSAAPGSVEELEQYRVQPPASAPPVGETATSVGEAVLSGIAKGGTFGLAPYISAATRKVLPESLPGGGRRGASYEQLLEEERQKYQDVAAERPFSTAAGEIAVNAPMFAKAAVSQAPKLLGTAERVAKTIGLGAAQGAGEKVGKGEAEEALTGALTGGALAAGGYAVGAGLGRLWERFGARELRDAAPKAIAATEANTREFVNATRQQLNQLEQIRQAALIAGRQFDDAAFQAKKQEVLKVLAAGERRISELRQFAKDSPSLSMPEWKSRFQNLASTKELGEDAYQSFGQSIPGAFTRAKEAFNPLSEFKKLPEDATAKDVLKAVMATGRKLGPAGAASLVSHPVAGPALFASQAALTGLLAPLAARQSAAQLAGRATTPWVRGAPPAAAQQTPSTNKQQSDWQEELERYRVR